MDTKELAKAKEQLESDLSRLMSDRLTAFRVKTGLSPRAITIEMMDARRADDPQPNYIVVHVEADIRL